MNSFFFTATSVSALLSTLGERGVTAKCRIPLNDDYNPCLAQCIHRNNANAVMKKNSGYDIFVCDTTASWLHHYSANPEFLPATPPEGSGSHEYAVYRGSHPPCDKNGSCLGCSNPPQPHLCSVFVDPKTCQVTCSSNNNAAHTTTTTTTNLVNNNQGAAMATTPFEVEEHTFQFIRAGSEDSSAGIATTSHCCLLTALGAIAWAVFAS